MSLARRKWTTFPSVEILAVETKNEGKGSYQAYKIEVTDGPDKWILFKRYTNFVELADRLHVCFLGERLPKLPPKPNLWEAVTSSRDSKFLEERRRKLERYLRVLLSIPHLFQSTEVRAFFDPESEMKSTKDGESFLLPPPPANVRIPHYVHDHEVDEEGDDRSNPPVPRSPERRRDEEVFDLINKSMRGDEDGVELSDMKGMKEMAEKMKAKNAASKEVTFLVTLLNGLKDGLYFINSVRIELASQGSNDPEVMFRILESHRGRLNSVTNELKAESQMITHILKIKAVEDQPSLFSYFELCQKTVSRGLQWLSATEDDVLNRLSNEIGTRMFDTSAPIDPIRMAIYEEEAERLAVQVWDPEISRGKVDEDIVKLIQQCQKEVQVLDADHRPLRDVNMQESIRKRLVQVLQYLKELRNTKRDDSKDEVIQQ